MERTDLRAYLQTHRVLTDGAFGTYFEARYNSAQMPERANLTDPQRVLEIHREYIEAGSRLIRTNTFAASREGMGCTGEELREAIVSACRSARQAAADAQAEVFVAGDIGPIPQSAAGGRKTRIGEYREILELMYESGLRIFTLETFPSIEEGLPAVEAFRRDHEGEDLYVLFSLCVNPHGYTNTGRRAQALLQELDASGAVDAVGLNCGVGPGPMKSLLPSLDLNTLKCAVSLVPNAGYPGSVGGRAVFHGNEEYFTGKMRELADLGTDFVGGCCGTNPRYIARMAEQIDLSPRAHDFPLPAAKKKNILPPKDSAFWKSAVKEKYIAVEVAPPYTADDSRLLDAVNALKGRGVDVITLPDSPSGRTRADSVLMGLKVHEATGLTVMPHICCRDKNIIGMRSYLIGAWLAGIRNALIITGDPVPTTLRQEARSVFNFDSVGLMRIIRDLNEEQFFSDPLVYGGAINYNRRNLSVEVRRMHQKIDAGARYFLTQPIYAPEDFERLQVFRREIDSTGKDVKLFVGVMPLISRKNALFIANEMTGMHVTEEIVNRFSLQMSRREGEQVGVAIAREVIAATSDIADGYYFSIPFNRVYLLDDIFA